MVTVRDNLARMPSAELSHDARDIHQDATVIAFRQNHKDIALPSPDSDSIDRPKFAVQKQSQLAYQLARAAAVEAVMRLYGSPALVDENGKPKMTSRAQEVLIKTGLY